MFLSAIYIRMRTSKVGVSAFAIAQQHFTSRYSRALPNRSCKHFLRTDSSARNMCLSFSVNRNSLSSQKPASLGLLPRRVDYLRF